MDSELFGFRKYGYFVVGLYNEYRTHSALNGKAPVDGHHGKDIDLKSYRWKQHCRGLYQTPMAA